MKLGIIGGGAMGEAIIAAVLKTGVTTSDQISVFELFSARLAYLSKTYGIVPAASAGDAAAGAEFVVMSVKPQDFETAAQMIGTSLPVGATVVSIMAGVSLAHLSALLHCPAAVRAMPNTPAQIGEGMTVWTATSGVDEAARNGVRAIFGALGREAYVPDEKYLDMATALSGSGPAYVFLFIEALIDAGVHIGLGRDLATTMAIQTVVGSANYALATGKHPAELRNQVTSPGGTTAAALRALEAGGLRATVLEAVIAAYNQSKALGEQAKAQGEGNTK